MECDRSSSFLVGQFASWNVLIHMFASLQTNRRSWWTWASVGAHAAVLAALLLHGPVTLSKAARPGTKHGTLAEVTYLPGSNTASRAVLDSAHPETIKPSPKPPVRAAEDPKLTLPPSAVRAQDTAAAASDAAGDGDITLALVITAPHPEPQRTPGMRGDVVIDVTIGADGKLSDAKVVRGLGSPIDQQVLATVQQQWSWHPATKNGLPVASEQELLFHYDWA